MMLDTLFLVSLAVCAGGLGLVAYTLASIPVPSTANVGMAGLRRQHAMSTSGMFRLLEPAVRVAAAWMRRLPIPGLRARAQEIVTKSGHHLGLAADELLGLALIAGLGSSAAIVIATATLGEVNPWLAIAFFPLGAWLTALSIRSGADVRNRMVYSQLSSAIDLIVLCLSAGLDFPGALRRVTQHPSWGDSPLAHELRFVLRELDFGHSRRQALMAFAARVPVEEVKEFISSVIQAEERGNPLVSVLATQAALLRSRRMLVAEEAGSRAAVLMVIPMTLIMMTTLIIIAGPLMLKAMAL
jgi:tight adherence protein C